MKRLGSGVSFALLIVLGTLFVGGVWQASAGSLFAPPPTSIPGTPIPTPLGFTVPPTPIDFRGDKRIAPPSFLPTVAPLPISRVTDLGPGLPNRCKSEVIVRRSNGMYETFLVPIGTDRSQVKSTLGPGDQIILDGPPPVLMGAHSRPTFTADGRLEMGTDPASNCQ